MAHAELIVSDENKARQSRLTNVAVKPLWTAFAKQLQLSSNLSSGPNATASLSSSSASTNHSQQHATLPHDPASNKVASTLHVSHSSSSLASRSSITSTSSGSMDGPPTRVVASLERPGVSSTDFDSMMERVLRFGTEVAEYREQCRHVQAILPPKQPVVVHTQISPLARKASGGSSSHMEDSTTPTTVAQDKLDVETRGMLAATWRSASFLLEKATLVAVDVQSSLLPVIVGPGSPATPSTNVISAKEGKRMSRSLETLCRHIDYVITGQHRQLSGDGVGFRSRSHSHTTSNGTKNKHNVAHPVNSNARNTVVESSHEADPPPIDLFDSLLAELQAIAAASDYRRQHCLTSQSGNSETNKRN